ncbi:DUF4349 domain-containing protein [Kitasatospora sp. NBC_01560]|uniref:DUF4349 domain-containing protein n=1 Tax=Kitasatospora sp. NBC_01560 TaxID=2975965 RepID=UPI003868F0FF
MVRERRGAGRGAAAAVAVVTVAVLAGGCGAGAERGADSAAAAKQEGAAAAGAPAVGAAPVQPSAAAKAGAPAADGAAQTGAVPVADPRLIAYTAQLSVRTKDVAGALAKARELAAAAGGYVGAETVSGTGEGSGQSGQITVKVPSATFQQTLDRLAALGEVLSRRSQADDLTQQVADVSSRVQTQQASVDRVRALMAQAKTLGEVTSLEGELSRREADLESLQKQLKELSARTSLSTVTVDVRQQAAPVPVAPEKEEDGFLAAVGSALGGGWHVLVAIVRGLAVAVAAAAPFLLVLVPAALAFRLVRRRRTVAAGAPAVPAEEAKEEATAERQDG